MRIFATGEKVRFRNDATKWPRIHSVSDFLLMHVPIACLWWLFGVALSLPVVVVGGGLTGVAALALI